MAEDTAELKRDIEETRRHLGRDVDALSEKVSPSRVVGRRMDSARGGIHRLREQVMGSAESARGSVSDTVSSAPDMARSHTRGTPLAAGLVAFTAGWIVAAAMPPSTRERELAQETKDKAMEVAGPVKEQATQAMQEVKENLQQPAQEAVDQVKQSASDAASAVADEGRSAAQQVKDESKDSADHVRQAGSST
jgi:gas vesicle protein